MERLGEDIANIKQDNIRVSAESYTFDNEKNSLYHKVEITYPEKQTYMKQYFIKYDLSDYQQELKELKMLYGGKYAQANFLFQEIDNQIDPKKVELISEFCIDKDTYKNLINSYNASKIIAPVFNSTINDFIVLDGKFNNDKYYTKYIADVLLISIDRKNQTISGGKIAKAKLQFDYDSFIKTDNNILEMKYFRNFATQEISETNPVTCYYQVFSSKNLAKTV